MNNSNKQDNSVIALESFRSLSREAQDEMLALVREMAAHDKAVQQKEREAK